MSDPFADWFNYLERSLEHDGERVGLSEHGTTTGSAREYLVKRVLRSFLPPMAHIGSGMIFDAKGGRSKQIDVIVYDSRFPVFELADGLGMYPAEGVIGAIEVKSTLKTTTYAESLDNCRSVMQLETCWDLYETQATWDARIGRTMQLCNLSSREEASRRIMFDLIPATYIFAFWSEVHGRGLRDATLRWMGENGFADKQGIRMPCLPRVVVAGKSIGTMVDGCFGIRQETESKNNLTPLMMFSETAYRLGVLATHLMRATSSRFGLTHGREGYRYTLSVYFENIIAAYADELGKSDTQSIDWAPTANAS